MSNHLPPGKKESKVQFDSILTLEISAEDTHQALRDIVQKTV